MKTKTRQELNKEIAERVMRGDIFETSTGHSWKFHGINGIPVDDWNPSEENSGQIFLVLDAMADMGFDIDTSTVTSDPENNFIFTILIFHRDEYNVSVSTKYCTDKSKRNPTILETCLIALDKKEG